MDNTVYRYRHKKRCKSITIYGTEALDSLNPIQINTPNLYICERIACYPRLSCIVIVEISVLR